MSFIHIHLAAVPRCDPCLTASTARLDPWLLSGKARLQSIGHIKGDLFLQPSCRKSSQDRENMAPLMSLVRRAALGGFFQAKRGYCVMLNWLQMGSLGYGRWSSNIACGFEAALLSYAISHKNMEEMWEEVEHRDIWSKVRDALILVCSSAFYGRRLHMQLMLRHEIMRREQGKTNLQ